MATINKGLTLSQTLSFLALALFFVSTTFKILHFPLAGEILLLSFGAIAASLLTTSLMGISLNKGKKGAWRLLSMVVGIIIFIGGFSFRVLHLPGADQLILLATGLLTLSLLANTLYIYRHASGEGNLLTFLHEKYTPGIERFFLLLLVPLAIYKAVSILNGSTDFAGNVILLALIFGAGLQFIVLCWGIMEEDLSKRNVFTLTAVLISALCLVTVFSGPLLPLPLRIVLIALYSVVSGWLAFWMERGPRRTGASLFLALAPLVFLAWGLMKINLMPLSVGHIFFNIPVLVLLVIGLFLCRRKGTMRTYMLVSVASYLFEYLA